MSVYAGPNIVEDGLVLSVDAANIRSYDRYENLLTNSQLGNATILNDYGAVTVTTDTSIANPFGGFDGVLKCDHTTEAVGGYFRRGELISLTAGVTYTFTVFFKNGTVSSPYSNDNLYISVLAGVGLGTGPTFDNHLSLLNTSNAYENGWYRQTLTFTPAYTQTYYAVFSNTVNVSPVGIYYIYGFQFEIGAAASEYYATTSTAKNRGTTWRDLSGYGNNGTLTNGPTYSNGSIVFDGTDDYISSVSIPNPNGELACEVAMNYDSKGAYHNIFDRGSSRPMLWIDPNNKLEVSFSTGDGGITSSDAYNGQDIVVTAVYNSNSSTGILLYVNGNLVGTKNTAHVTWPNPSTFTLFNRNNSQTFDGKLYYLRFYTKALSASEIKQNFNALRGRYGI